MKNRTSGFTLVELMVVVVLVALVVLVSTQIPLFTFSFWRKGMERLKLQRDGNYAMIKIQHELRPASLSDINASGSTLDIGGASFFLEELEEDRLCYQASVGAPKEPVIEGYTDIQFAVEKIWNVTTTDAVINVTLTLNKKNAGTVKLETAVEPRN